MVTLVDRARARVERCRPGRRPGPRRGTVLVFVALGLTAFVALFALVVDAGGMYFSRSRLQTAADAAALAAAGSLPDSVSQATANANTLAIRNLGRIDQITTPYKGNPDWVEIVVVGDYSFLVAPFLGDFKSTRLRARAVAQAGKQQPSTLPSFNSVFGKNDLKYQGNSVVDSYDSAKGSYTSQATNYDTFTGFFYADPGDARSDRETYFLGRTLATGNVFTGNNATPPAPPTGGGETHLTGTAVHVKGNVTSAGAITVAGAPVVDGVQSPNTYVAPMALPPIDLKDYATNNSNSQITHPAFDASSKDLRLTGTQVLRLTSGTYYFNEVSFVGNSKLEIDGNVTIYAVNGWTMTGGSVVNLSQDPTRFSLFLAKTPTGTGFGATINGGSDFFGTIYNPYDTVTLTGGSSFFGALTAKEIYIQGNSSTHIDRAVVRKFAPARQRLRLVE